MASTLDDALLTAPRWALAKRRADELTFDYSSPPIPVLEIAEMSGVDVEFIDFEEFDNAVAGFCDFEQKSICVNVLDPPNRQTFTMAHELGHWILHRDYYIANPDKYPVLPRFGNPDNSNPMEKEANHFASNLLVPARLLRPVISAPIARLSEIFGVSRQMMEFRVKNAR